MKRWLLGLVLSLFAGLAVAQTYVAQFPPNPGVMPGGGWQYSPGSNFGDPPGPRAWTNGKYGGVPQFKATDLYRLPGPAGVLPVGVVSTAGLTGAALAVGRCVVGLNPICAAGTAAYMVYDKYRARPVDGVNEQICGGVPCSFPSGQWDFDPGQDPQSQTVDCTNVGENPWTDSCTQTPEAYAKPRAQQLIGGETPTVLYNYVDGGTRFIAVQTTTPPPGCIATGDGSNCRSTRYFQFSLGSKVVNGCPAVIDPFDPQYSLPAGSPLGPDGKCPSGRNNRVPRTPDQLADHVNNYPPELPNADWGRAVSDAIDLGGQKAPASLTGSGPAQQTGAPVTTSAPTPGGGTTTTTTTPTTNYTYNNTTNNYPSITYTTTNNYNTNTCTATNSCTTSSGSNPGPSSGTPLQDPTDPCVKNPGALQCLKVGEPGTEKPTWEEKTITYTPEAVDLPAQCPAPWTGTFKGQAWVVSFTPACDIAPIIKAALLACVGLGCMLLLSREVV